MRRDPRLLWKIAVSDVRYLVLRLFGLGWGGGGGGGACVLLTTSENVIVWCQFVYSDVVSS